MKTLNIIMGGVIAVVCALGTPACQSSRTRGLPQQNTRPVRLQVVVNLPVSMNLLRDDDLVTAFGQEVVAALHQQGFRGRLKVVDEDDLPIGSIPTLNVYLLEWHGAGNGEIECMFQASLGTTSGVKQLGLFSAAHLRLWDYRDWTLRNGDYHRTDAQALATLAERIEKSGEFRAKSK